MQIKFALLAAALSAGVASDFVVVSIGLGDIDLRNINSQISQIQNYVTSKIGQLTASLPASEISRAASAQTALANFVQTAPSSYSIPSKVTQLGAYETFTSVPAWYSALPSDLKAYYDQNNARVQSAVNEALGKTTGNVTPGRSATGAGSQSTGVASPDKVVQYMGVGAAAAFAGVFAL